MAIALSVPSASKELLARAQTMVSGGVKSPVRKIRMTNSGSGAPKSAKKGDGDFEVVDDGKK